MTEEEKIHQYATKILLQLEPLFKEWGDNFINTQELSEGNNGTLFFHALANTVPTYIYNNFSEEKVDILEFNHIANNFCFQFSKAEDNG